MDNISKPNANSTGDNSNSATALLNNPATYIPQRMDGPFNEEYLIGAIKVEFTNICVPHLKQAIGLATYSCSKSTVLSFNILYVMETERTA